jgi:hypothetical protein
MLVQREDYEKFAKKLAVTFDSRSFSPETLGLCITEEFTDEQARQFAATAVMFFVWFAKFRAAPTGTEAWAETYNVSWDVTNLTWWGRELWNELTE